MTLKRLKLDDNNGGEIALSPINPDPLFLQYNIDIAVVHFVIINKLKCNFICIRIVSCQYCNTEVGSRSS